MCIRKHPGNSLGFFCTPPVSVKKMLMLYFKIGYMWGIPYPSMEKARHKFRVFALPPHSIIQKSFWLRTALKRFDFCKLFLYYLSMIDRYTIGIDYDKVVASSD